MRTLILLFICSLFFGVGALDAKSRDKERREIWLHACLAAGVGVAVCWFLVRVVGIFDHWSVVKP